MSENVKRILITEVSKTVINTIKGALKSGDYQIRVASDGEECLKLIETFKPDLVVLDLLASKIHGIDILKSLKGDEATKHIGVIITTGHAIAQDYDTALAYGADACLIKPFDVPSIQQVIEDFFAGTLKALPFSEQTQEEQPADRYRPSPTEWSSYVKFWGTRGSIPVAGIEYFRYGGNTACLEVSDGDDLVIIDAGTGIRGLGNEIVERDNIDTIHLFIGHTHWDHIIGFPFFAPVYQSKYKIHIYAARGFHKSMEELFTGMLDHDFFPVRLEDMQAEFIFHDLVDYRPIQIGNLHIHYESASHPGATLCFKIESKDRTIGYATDNEFLVGYHGHPGEIDRRHPILEPYIDIVNFYTGCDIVVHEAQYTPDEYLSRTGWGHSSISNASILIKHCKAPEWVVTHHDPANSDEALIRRLELHREVLGDCKIDCRTFMAYDGLSLPL